MGTFNNIYPSALWVNAAIYELPSEEFTILLLVPAVVTRPIFCKFIRLAYQIVSQVVDEFEKKNICPIFCV